jgi:hypothetical protein
MWVIRHKGVPLNYPVWYLPDIGGGTLIALISIVHVFLSHFAVGGGLYLVCAERKGLREGNQAILDFTKMHARFFLLLTMVMGGITGVGIWFIISLVNPAATSILIHTFVFGWATEWVFFIVEIVAIFIYYYCFGRMDSKTHQAVGWIYFIAAWLSLFVINGIIGYMLTPGMWLEDGSFWSGIEELPVQQLEKQQRANSKVDRKGNQKRENLGELIGKPRHGFTLFQQSIGSDDRRPDHRIHQKEVQRKEEHQQKVKIFPGRRDRIGCRHKSCHREPPCSDRCRKMARASFSSLEA